MAVLELDSDAWAFSWGQTLGPVEEFLFPRARHLHRGAGRGSHATGSPTPLSPVVHGAVGVWGAVSGRLWAGWSWDGGAPGGLLTPSQVLVVLWKAMGLKTRPRCRQAARSWGVSAGAPSTGRSQWSPSPPACPQGRGNSGAEGCWPGPPRSPALASFPADGFQAALDEDHLQPALGQAGIFPSPAPRDRHELPTPL